MTIGTIIENMSGRKLMYVVSGLIVLQILCFLLGAIVSPTPNSSMQLLAQKCYDKDGGKNKDKWFSLRDPSYPGKKNFGTCQRIHSLEEQEYGHMTAENVVFAFQMPLPKNNMHLTFSRWQQSLIGVLSLDIEYEEEEEHPTRSELFIDARIAYKNRGDKDWNFLAESFVHRSLECEIEQEKKKPGYFYNCSILPLFELGSLHHDYYLLNLRLPTMYDHNGQEMLKNQDIGKLVDVWMTGIIQNGGFTKVWVALKTIFLPVVLVELFWFRKRLKQLPRSPTLLEKTLLFLGTSLSILNLPLEYLTLTFDMPWLPLVNDFKQGLFYASLMVFWLVFAGEHLLNDDGTDSSGPANGIMSYARQLAIVLFGCVCLFIFDLCERGVQLNNPFHSIWVSDMGARMALAFIIFAGVSAGVFFLFLCYTIYRVFLTIATKQATLSNMRAARRLHYQGLIWRFRFLMMATLITAALTVIGFIIGQVSEGQYKWDEDISLEYTSGFMTGVYGMWNIYIMGLLFLYAPSHKQWPTSASSNTLNDPHGDGTSRTGEEIEFAMSSKQGATSPTEESELTSLSKFIRNPAID